MSFLLDTNILSAHRRRALTHRFVQHSGRLYTSSVSLGELYVWAYGRNDPTKMISSIEKLLAFDVSEIPFDNDCAQRFGKVRVELRRKGIEVNTTDVMIGSVALFHDLTLVTHNTVDFQSIPGLHWKTGSNHNALHPVCLKDLKMSNPLVGILMGSDSDWPKIKAAAAALAEFHVPYEVHVMSAHRTPDLVQQYASTAAARGLRVIIAAAGGAAHLAGVVAAHTVLPVIGIPVPTELQGGLDSLLSMVQMPGDVPVATVGVGGGGARNAGLLAVQMLALADPALQEKYTAYKQALVEKVLAKDAALQATIKP